MKSPAGIHRMGTSLPSRKSGDGGVCGVDGTPMEQATVPGATAVNVAVPVVSDGWLLLEGVTVEVSVF